MIHVRPATNWDIDWMLDQSAHFSQFIGTKRSVFPEREQGALFLQNWMDTQPLFIAENDGRPVGFMLAALHPHLLNPDLLVLTEILWWVEVESRATRAGALLLLAFQECAERVGADWQVVTLEAHSPLNPDALEKRGYRLQERCFLKER